MKNTFPFYLILACSFLFSAQLIGQQTMSAKEITKERKKKEIEKRQLIEELANPTSREATIAGQSKTKKDQKVINPNTLTVADIQSIQTRIDSKKALLAKNKAIMDKADIEEAEKLIQAAEKDLIQRKKISAKTTVTEVN